MATIALGALAQALSGKAGNAVFYRTNDQLRVRDYAIPFDPQTPLQLASRERFAQANFVWSSLSPDQADAWRQYALSLGVRQPGSTAVRSPRAQNLFVGLAAKVLQIDPVAPVPVDPPDAPFFGDALSVSALGGTEITFEANAPNGEAALTELLIQPLATGARAPLSKAYRTAAFVRFAPGSLDYALLAPPGWYATAYRFVSPDTGQQTALAPCGIVRVDT
ncbi:MAG: hypothetical protein HUU60_10690 [Armatimonadetes bacterium]|nr:hypothetical protein [Armatimonadota bacterium]